MVCDPGAALPDPGAIGGDWSRPVNAAFEGAFKAIAWIVLSLLAVMGFI
jgi:hypothetical protein